MVASIFRIKARPLVPGAGEGRILYVDALSFYGEVDPVRGKLVDGRYVKGRVLVIGRVRGSTVGSYTIYGLRFYGNAPSAIIVVGEADPIVVAGAVMAGIPLYDRAAGIDERAEGGFATFREDGLINVVLDDG